MLPINALAHEMFYTGSSPNWVAVPLIWDSRSNSKAYLKMNGDYLSSDYSDEFLIVSYAWQTASSKVLVERTSFSDSNIDLSTATKYYWDNRFGGEFYSKYVGGVCDITSTDNIQITNASTASASSGRIRYAGILVTPYVQDFFDADNPTNHRRAVLIHEIGHTLGLGHSNTNYYPTTDASIMRTYEGYEGYYRPQDHDKNDVSAPDKCPGIAQFA